MPGTALGLRPGYPGVHKSQQGSQSTQFSEGVDTDTDKIKLQYNEVKVVIEPYMEVLEERTITKSVSVPFRRC